MSPSKPTILSFKEFMNKALYGSQGFYIKNHPIFGRNGHFYTASSTSLWGKTLAHYFRNNFEVLRILEGGGGTGELAKDIIDTISPLEYIILEISPSLRKIQQKNLKARRVKWIKSLEEIRTFSGIILFIEFLDAFPVHRLKKKNGKFYEIGVQWDKEKIEETLLPICDKRLLKESLKFTSLPEGYQLELPIPAVEFLEKLSSIHTKGELVIIDYGYRGEEIYRYPNGTVRAFYKHRILDDPYQFPGQCDITYSINFSLIVEVLKNMGYSLINWTTQEKFLIESGILELLNQNPSSEKMKIKQLGALKTLIHPQFMGNFSVLRFKK